MESEFYYILVQNNRTNDNPQLDNFHLERVLYQSDAISILENENVKHISYPQSATDRYHCQVSDFLLVTDDYQLITKYLRVINVDELKMLCNIENYDIKRIRINKDYFSGYKQKTDLYNYFNKILNNEIVSATMFWDSVSMQPYGDSSYTDDYKIFDEWKENHEFVYLKTPYRYKINEEDESIFKFENLKKSNLQSLNQMFNCNILQMGCEYRNGLLRHFDTISRKRLYINTEVLDEIIKLRSDEPTNPINLIIETKLDKNLYLEYYITNLDNNNSNNIENTYRDFDNHTDDIEIQNRNNWLEDAAGTNNPEITNDVFWNLD